MEVDRRWVKIPLVIRPQCKDRMTYQWNYLFSHLLELGLAQDRCGMKVDLFLSVTRKQGGLLVDMDQVWIHASHQGCLHHGPVLRIQIHITDVTASTGPHETWGTNRPFQILVFIYLFNKKKRLNVPIKGFLPDPSPSEFQPIQTSMFLFLQNCDDCCEGLLDFVAGLMLMW